MTKAYLFPGQGAQTVTMASEILTTYPAAQPLYEEASEYLGFNLATLEADQLNQTRFAQPAIVIHSIACLQQELEKGEDSGTAALAGFSLGEYTALFAAQCLSLQDLLKLLNKRAELMQQAAEETPGAMYAILGLEDQVIEDTLQEIPDVYPVNYNCKGQLVIAGSEEAAAKAAETLLSKGARRAMKLAVNGAFHSPFMKKAATGLESFAQSLSYSPPQRVIYSNATGEKIPANVDFPSYLANHMISPVRFQKEILTMRADGYDHFIELGPGKVLSGFLKKI